MRLFKKYRKQAKIEYEKSKKIKKSLGTEWYKKIEEYHTKVQDNLITYMMIPDMLRARQFNPEQIKKFMKDYDKFDRAYKLNTPEPEKESEEE